MKTHSNDFIKQRKFYMVLPLLVLPFITVIFWALGGGQGIPAQATAVESHGLNVQLPSAQLTNDAKMWDKVWLYQKAKQDSAKYQEAKRNDPYFRFSTLTDLQDKDKKGLDINASLGKKDPYADLNEARVNEKIDELYRQINQGDPTPHTTKQKEVQTIRSIGPVAEEKDPEILRLEAMMKDLNAPVPADPEMMQMDGMLDKILDIQHPERVKARFGELEELKNENVMKVSTPESTNEISIIPQVNSLALDSTSMEELLSMSEEPNGFYGLDDNYASNEILPQGFEAVVHSTQELVSGSTTKLRLTSPIDVNNIRIPSNEFIYGTCAISGERLSIKINSIRYGSTILPVTLSVYDLDGLEGIYIPGAIARDVAKQSASQSIQDIQLMSMNPSLEVQAAGAGLEAVKGLFTKKMKLIKVTVKTGYKVLLRDLK